MTTKARIAEGAKIVRRDRDALREELEQALRERDEARAELDREARECRQWAFKHGERTQQRDEARELVRRWRMGTIHLPLADRGRAEYLLGEEAESKLREWGIE